MLRAHPRVDDCAVVGISDPHWGQAVVGCVVSSDPPDVASLEAHARASDLAGFKRPRAYFFTAEVPRNPGNGNILRRLLRDAAGAAREEGADSFVSTGST